MTTYEGHLSATGLRVAVAVSRFNEFITDRLLQGATETWRRSGGDPDQLDVARVPGAFELPLVAKALAETGRFDAVVGLGCVIRGSTSHYDHVCAGVTSGIMQAAMGSGLPVIFGVITTETIEQAIERAGTKAGNKGTDAMLSAIEMATLLKRIKDAA